VFTTTLLNDGIVGVEYSATLRAITGAPPLTWSVAAGGTLPPGLALDSSTGQITGTPTTVGTFAFTIQATDTGNRSTTRDFTIAIGDPADPRVVLISLANDGSRANSDSGTPALSDTGRYLAFTSFADNLAAGDTNGFPDVYLRDLDPGCLATVRVSVASDGTEANSQSFAPTLSSVNAGRLFVAYVSDSNNLVPDDTNRNRDVFATVVDVSGCPPAPLSTARVSVATDGSESNDLSQLPSISADGLAVAYHSQATNLVDTDTNELTDIFLTTLNFSGGLLSVMETRRANLFQARVAVDVTDTTADIFSDTTIGSSTLTLANNAHVGRVVQIVAGTGASQVREITANDATTLTVSPAWDPVPTDTSVFRVIAREDFPADIFTSTTVGNSALTMTDDEHVSRNRRVVIGTVAANIFSDTTIGNTNFLLTEDNHVDQVVQIVGGTGEGQSRRIVTNSTTTFTVSPAWDTVPDDTSTFQIVSSVASLVEIVSGTGAGQLRLIIQNSTTTFTIDPAWSPPPDATSAFRILQQGNAGSFRARLSADGALVVFDTASAFEEEDTNRVSDVFVYDRAASQTRRVSADPTGALPTGASNVGDLNTDGSLALFRLFLPSSVTELVPNTTADIFSATTIGSSTLSLTPDEFIDQTAEIVEGTGLGQTRTITTNTATTLTVDPAWDTVPDTTSVFRVTELIPGTADLFTRDLATGQVDRISLADDGSLALGTTDTDGRISAGGRLVVFATTAGNLVDGDENSARDIYLRDTCRGAPVGCVPSTRRISLALGGTNPNSESVDPAISLDATTVAFASTATNLVADDNNNGRDIFLVTTGVNDPGPPPPAPIILATQLPPARQGVAYSARLPATGGTQPQFWSVSQGALPPGLFLDPKTGMLTGTPQRPGRYRFTIMLMDAQRPAHRTQRTLILVVSP